MDIEENALGRSQRGDHDTAHRTSRISFVSNKLRESRFTCRGVNVSDICPEPSAYCKWNHKEDDPAFSVSEHSGKTHTDSDKDDYTGVIDVEDDARAEETNLQEELNVFRAQWMSELTPNGSSNGSEMEHGRISAKGLSFKSLGTKGKQELAREEKAKELFLKAVEQEQNGAVYEAIKYYRRAMQLVPDIEFKINYAHSPESEGGSKAYKEDKGKANEVIDLLPYFQQQLSLQDSPHKICQPEFGVNQTHISDIPFEILVYIFRWVVSSHLDLRSLEQLSMVCRAFYVCARDPEIWRLACLKVWGRACSTLVLYSSWRHMFLERPRVRFDGVYISKTTYVRQGEESLDGFYRAWHQVEYYRYLRFFPGGQVIMLTTPEDPQSIVPRLCCRTPRIDAVLFGHFRLSQETDNQTKVFAVLAKKKEEKTPEYQKYRYYRRAPPPTEIDHNFHVGLQLASSGRQRFNKLVWLHHSCLVTYKSTGETAVSTFDIDKMYTPLFFARVKSFTAFSETPL